MSNEVEIVVKSKDKTDFGPMKAKAKVEGGKAGDAASDSFGKATKKGSAKSGDQAGKSFGSSLKKWFGGGSAMKEIGESGGTVFGSGFLGMLKTPVLGPAIGAAMAAAVAVALPAVGAVAASGLIAGFGAGLAGLGIVFAAKSEAVKKKWKDTLTGMGKDMSKLSQPFESTLMQIADFADRTFQKFKPSLEAVFKEMAPAVTNFVDEVAAGFELLQPAIRPIAEAFDAVLASLGPAIQSAIKNVSKGLQDLAASVKKNPDGLADMVEGLGDLTRKTLDAINFLNDFNGKIKDLTGGTSAVDIAFGKANSKIGEFIGFVKNALNPLHAVTDLMGVFGTKTKDVTGAVGLTGDAAKLFTQGLTETQIAAVMAGGSISATGAIIEAAGVKFNRQTRATDALIASLFRLKDAALTLSGAQISFQAAIDAASASIKENGKTLNINTEKGRANKTALDAVAKSANDQYAAMIKSNKGLDASALAAEASRANFVKLAQQMGATKPQAEAMARSLIVIPNVSRTARLTANKKDLETKLAAAKRELKDPDLTKSREAKLKANIKKLEDGIAAALAALKSVPASKTVTITSRFITERIVKNQSGGNGGHEPGFATGGTPPKGKFWVGENGPELMDLSGTMSPARVTPSGNSARQAAHAAGGGGSPQTIVLELRNSGRDDFGDFLIHSLQSRLQARGGNVQVILGGRKL